MPRAYAVGAAFSVRDVVDTWQWRPTDRFWTDVEYREPKPPEPKPPRQRAQRARLAASAVVRRVDPSKIRTPQEQRTAGRRVCNS